MREMGKGRIYLSIAVNLGDITIYLRRLVFSRIVISRSVVERYRAMLYRYLLMLGRKEFARFYTYLTYLFVFGFRELVLYVFGPAGKM